MGACCCRRKVSVETQTIFVGRPSECTHMDALNEDHCRICVNNNVDIRMPSNRNPKTLRNIDSYKNNIDTSIINPSNNIDTSIINPSTSNRNFVNSEINNYSHLEKRFLDEHNYYRGIHGCPPLILNQSLSILAKEWARHLSLKKSIQYRSDPKFGENIYMCSINTFDPTEIVTIWYNEIQYYNFDEDILTPNTVHFTQLIWKSSKELGIGIEQIDNTIWIVAFYSPPGNYLSQFDDNVPPPSQQTVDVNLA